MKAIISYKKSILFSIGFLFLAGYAKAQNLERIHQLLAGKELAHAREAVDSAAILNPTAAVLLLKAQVYAQLSNDVEYKNLLANARWEAFLSLQKAIQIDKEAVYQQLAAEKYKLVYNIYDGFTREGLAYFNAGAGSDNKESFTTALGLFKKAAAVNQWIYTNNWGKAEVDTLNLFYLSKAALFAEKEEDALFYCKKIADNTIIFPAFKTGYAIIYEWLLYYYKGRKDAANFTKYLALGKQQFPLSDYFTLAELEWLRQQQQYPELFAKYKQLLQAAPGNSNYKLAFYRDQFQYIWRPEGTNQQNKVVNIPGLIAGLQRLTNDPQSLVALNARLLLAKVYIHQSQDVNRELLMRSTTDKTVTDSYKKRSRNLLVLSNKYLRQILSTKNVQQLEAGREAAQLLQSNTIALKQR